MCEENSRNLEMKSGDVGHPELTTRLGYSPKCLSSPDRRVDNEGRHRTSPPLSHVLKKAISCLQFIILVTAGVTAPENCSIAEMRTNSIIDNNGGSNRRANLVKL
jgi:hypothetical protein